RVRCPLPASLRSLPTRRGYWLAFEIIFCTASDFFCDLWIMSIISCWHERTSMKLRNRTTLITGGSAGIGLAFALKFLELGNEVIVTGRRQTVLDAVKAKYPKLHTIQSDVADPQQIAALARRVKADFPKLDVLMNNAGILLYKNLKSPAADLTGLMAEMNV